MRLALIAAAVGSAVALVGIAGAAHASTAIDLNRVDLTALGSVDYGDALPQLGPLRPLEFGSSSAEPFPPLIANIGAAGLSDGALIDGAPRSNKVFQINVIEPGELAMMVMGVAAMLFAGRGRND
jgi:hypothetical protein